MDEDYYFITLRCYDCENNKCELCPCGTIVHEEDLKGCIRKVSEETYAKYEHYIEEVLPFLKGNKSIYKEIIDFLFSLYEEPVSQKLNRKGKVI